MAILKEEQTEPDDHGNGPFAMTGAAPVPWLSEATLSAEEEEAAARHGLNVRNHRALWETAKLEAAGTDDEDLREIQYWLRVRTIFLELVALQ